jgi:hypothetical protein
MDILCLHVGYVYGTVLKYVILKVLVHTIPIYKRKNSPLFRIRYDKALYKTILQINFCVGTSVPDQEPKYFGPPGSGSVSQRYGTGSFHHQAKIVRKPFISTVLLLFYTYLIFEE